MKPQTLTKKKRTHETTSSSAKKSTAQKRKPSADIVDRAVVCRKLFDTTPDGILILDANTGQIIDVTPGMVTLLHYSRKEFLKKNILDISSIENPGEYHKAVKELRIHKYIYHGDIPLKTKDGIRLNVMFNCHIFKVGRKEYIQCSIREMPDHAKASSALQESEEKYRTILESIEDGYYESDLAGNFSFFNDAVCRIWGFPKEELMGMNYLRYLNGETAAKLYAAHHQVYKTGMPGSQFDYEIIRKDGTRRIVQSSFSLLKDREGNPTGFRGVIRDVTERKAAQEALFSSEEKYRQAFSSTSDIILMMDQELRISSVTPSVEKILGYKPEELIDRRVDELSIFSAASLEEAIANTLRVFAGELISNTIYEVVAKDGSIRFGEITASPIQKDGAIIGMIAIARDVTERKHAEDALIRNEYFLRKSQEVAQLGSYNLNIKTGQWASSSIFDKIFGIDENHPRNLQGWLDIIHPDDREEMRSYLSQHVVKDKNLFEKEHRIIRRSDGQERWVYGVGELTFDKDGNIDRMIGTIQDITDRRRMEEDIVKSEQRYRTIVENSQEGIFQTSPDNDQITFNPAFANMLGYASPEEAAKSITSIAGQVYVNPGEYPKMLDIILREDGIKGYETEFYRKDKSRIWVNMSVSAVHDHAGNLLYYHGIVEDITPKKKLEQERQESIKRLRKSLGATIHAMSATVEARDPYTAGHQRRVADLARTIATDMKLPRDQIDGIRMAGMIHDLGKISVPSEILTKPTRLTTLEFELIKTHSEAGYNILKDIEFPWPIARMVLEHHERMDGSGYPNGLIGENILLESKIIAVADVVEAISSNRPYRPAFGLSPALDEIAKNSGILYDADVVKACLKLFRENRYEMPT